MKQTLDPKIEQPREKRYEKPAIIVVEDAPITGVEAYSTAAVPASFPAIVPTAIIIAAIFTKYC